MLVGYDLDAGTVTVSDVNMGIILRCRWNSLNIFTTVWVPRVVLRQGNWKLFPDCGCGLSMSGEAMEGWRTGMRCGHFASSVSLVPA